MILVTGGAGYIGSHCVLKLLEMNKDIVVFDNFSTGFKSTINTLQKIKFFEFIEGDLRNFEDINYVFKKYNIRAVFHFAAFSQVEESIKNPEKYYLNNVEGTKNLLKAMVENNVKKIVFSSTAAVYGNAQYLPIDEKHSLKPINPYGETKLKIENILDEYDIMHGLKSVRLRYFNVAGADSLARIGEKHNPETHLIPNILKSIYSCNEVFKIFGDTHPTKDGTCIRDYINIEDLIDAHILALQYLNNGGKTNVFNLGTKSGNSVKEVFEICEKITNEKIKFEIMPKREGDPAQLIADNLKAKEVLNWQPKRDLFKSIQTAFEWEKRK